MLIETPILRDFIRKNRDNFLFVYGNDILDRCMNGQASECKDELNARHVVVRWKCCTDSSAFIHDFQFNLMTKEHIDRLISYIVEDGRIVIPLPRIGEGFSRLKIEAPKTWAYLKEQIDKIAHKDITYVRSKRK